MKIEYSQLEVVVADVSLERFANIIWRDGVPNGRYRQVVKVNFI